MGSSIRRVNRDRIIKVFLLLERDREERRKFSKPEGTRAKRGLARRADAGLEPRVSGRFDG